MSDRVLVRFKGFVYHRATQDGPRIRTDCGLDRRIGQVLEWGESRIGCTCDNCLWVDGPEVLLT